MNQSTYVFVTAYTRHFLHGTVSFPALVTKALVISHDQKNCWCNQDLQLNERKSRSSHKQLFFWETELLVSSWLPQYGSLHVADTLRNITLFTACPKRLDWLPVLLTCDKDVFNFLCSLLHWSPPPLSRNHALYRFFPNSVMLDMAKVSQFHGHNTVH